VGHYHVCVVVFAVFEVRLVLKQVAESQGLPVELPFYAAQMPVRLDLML
jgi:hypothetical protein